ncbi:MAG TPA: hypothetical protein VMW56_05385, partial [Candidatus Margulisiibacteriota bacterium]|nr:hypothetical protein [Candidatus Margulisiibacteriota bacterium]
MEGPFSQWDLLEPLERFVRGIVLHDEMVMEIEPWPYDSNADDEAGPEPRNVVTGVGPVLTGYESVLSAPIGVGPRPAPDIALSPEMLRVAAEISNAGQENVYYKAHVEFMQRTLGAVRAGGSAICDGDVWRAIDARATSFPAELFATLDDEWKEYARTADAGQIGPVIPPVLSIVLSRAGSRDRTCTMLQDLRDEWADARAKVWVLVDAMKEAATMQEFSELRRHLNDATPHFSPKRDSNSPRPLRVLWNVLADAGAGAFTASVAGGVPLIGATVGSVRAGVAAAAKTLPESLDALLRRGA